MLLSWFQAAGWKQGSCLADKLIGSWEPGWGTEHSSSLSAESSCGSWHLPPCCLFLYLGMGGFHFRFPSSLSSKAPYLALACLFISMGRPLLSVWGKELVVQLEQLGSLPESGGLFQAFPHTHTLTFVNRV